jgi:hypothetical protein
LPVAQRAQVNVDLPELPELKGLVANAGSSHEISVRARGREPGALPDAVGPLYREQSDGVGGRQVASKAHCCCSGAAGKM